VISWRNMDAESRKRQRSGTPSRHEHDTMMKDYKDWTSSKKTLVTPEEAILKEHHQFLRDDDDDAVKGETDWKVRMAVRYYQKLFKEYALGDFSRYREGKVGLRWRTEAEVVSGKGQFICGNKACVATEELESYELLFAYVEQGEKKSCLVKLRVCPPCAAKLFFKKAKEKKKKSKRSKHRR
jgi:protein FRA10AC1